MSGHTFPSPTPSPPPVVEEGPRKPRKGSQFHGDPFARLMAPPVNETLLQRTEREAREREAKRVSDEIDASLEIERRKLKSDRGVKVLLLGQSESGKTTTLKQFQLKYAPQAFRAERASWRLVIQLNLVRHIHVILDQIQQFDDPPPAPTFDQPSTRTTHSLGRTLNHSTTSLAQSLSGHISSDTDSPLAPGKQNMSAQTVPKPSPLSQHIRLTDDHRTLRLRLFPLLSVEASLLRRLDPADEFEATRLGTDWHPPVHKELYVRSQSNWKDKLARLRGPRRSGDDLGIDFDDPEDPGHVIHACREDMMTLWRDPVVRQIVRDLHLEDTPGFFLDDIDRITAERYVPSVGQSHPPPQSGDILPLVSDFTTFDTTEDVLKARLKTIGVSEHKFTVEIGEKTNWTIYDVGGTRTQRAAWQPYFEHVNALIFLAPISAFDQALVEDRRVNRLEDSLLLFKAVCSSKLLKNVNILLFLNKIDILENKLKEGVKVARYVKSYGERPNEIDPVCKFFRGKFSAIHREYTPRPSTRTFYVHLTTVTDPKVTSVLLATVCDVIFRDNLRSSHLC